MHWPLLILLVLTGSLQQPQQYRIGSIDFFGTANVDVAQIQAALPIHPGDQLTEEQLSTGQGKAQLLVTKTLGHKATDVNLVCCDAGGSWMIYIGLGGSNTTPVSILPAPTGQTCLPEPALQLYREVLGAYTRAVEAGNNGEDDSQGYALSNDPETRKIQLQIRKYAVANEPTVMQALQSCGKNEDREAASIILGYAMQSKEQIAALVQATRDPDGGTRNNSLRALSVMTAAKSSAAAAIPAAPFIEMLNSGTWTDRNKSGFLLYKLSASRDPNLLRLIQAQAMPSLIEMARWKNPGHAAYYRVILGRIAGIQEDQIQKLIDSGKVEEIIAAAKK
jgi:hypothetical protein